MLPLSLQADRPSCAAVLERLSSGEMKAAVDAHQAPREISIAATEHCCRIAAAIARITSSLCAVCIPTLGDPTLVILLPYLKLISMHAVSTPRPFTGAATAATGR